jgi:hypothetical protein
MVLGKSVELWGAVRGWYEFREGYGHSDYGQHRMEVQNAMRNNFTWDDGFSWSQDWRYPLGLVHKTLDVLALAAGTNVRHEYQSYAQEVRRMGHEAPRVSRLIVWLAENAGEIHFPEEF